MASIAWVRLSMGVGSTGLVLGKGLCTILLVLCARDQALQVVKEELCFGTAVLFHLLVRDLGLR